VTKEKLQAIFKIWN